MKIAEDRLLPAIRAAVDQAVTQTIIAANGTSCREQIAHGTDRAALHPIEVFAAALSMR